MFAQCQAHPGVLAFMMDQWAELLEQQGPAAAAAAAAEGQQQAEQAAAVTPKPMLEWLSEKLQVGSMLAPHQQHHSMLAGRSDWCEGGALQEAHQHWLLQACGVGSSVQPQHAGTKKDGCCTAAAALHVSWWQSHVKLT